MTDEKDQASSDTPPKYRALRDGTGYHKDEIFKARPQYIVSQKENNLGGGDTWGDVSFTPEGSWVPIFSEGHLQASPDFEEIEELWEPREGDNGFHAIGVFADCFDNKRGLRELIIQRWEGKYQETGECESNLAWWHNLKDESFRTEPDAQSCLDEVIELIQKRSKESRKL